MQSEYVDHLPRAIPIAKERGVANTIAWQMWLHHVTTISSKKFVILHPFARLLKALLLYAVCCPSTHGLEAGFGQTRKVWNAQRRLANDLSEDFCTCMINELLRGTKASEMRDMLIEQARVIWTCLYGRVRRSTELRIDKGCPRKQLGDKEDRCTETAFLKRRRQAMSQEANAVLKKLQKADNDTFSFDVGLLAIPDDESLELDQPIQKELAFLTTKERKSLILALRDNQLLPGEVTHELQLFAKAEETEQAKAQRARERTKARAIARTEGLSFIDVKENIKDLKVIVSAADVTDDALDEGCPFRTMSVPKARVFIVNDLEFCKLKPKFKLAIVLTGAYVMTPLALSGSGPIIKFKAGFSTHRTIVVSQRLLDTQPDKVDFLKMCHSHYENGNKWKFVYDEARFLSAKTTAKTAANSVGLVTADEKRGTFKDVKHTFTFAEMIDRLKHNEQDKNYRGSSATLRHMTF